MEDFSSRGAGSRAAASFQSDSRMLPAGNLWNLKEVDEKTKLFDRFRKPLVIDRFDNVTAAAQFMASVDLSRVVSGGEHTNWNGSQLCVSLELAEDFDSVKLRHSDVEKKEVRRSGSPFAFTTPAEKKIQNFLPVSKSLDTIIQARARQILFN